MISRSLCLISAIVCSVATAAPDDRHAALETIHRAALRDSDRVYAELGSLVDKAPGRLCGSEAYSKAVAWARTALAAAGADSVMTLDSAAPHWERGAPESLELADGGGVPEKLALLALGGSGATPDSGLEAGVVVVRSLEELEALGRAKVEGRIVFFDCRMRKESVAPADAYGELSPLRTRGPNKAATLGASAALIRSLTFSNDDVPHTGMTRFDPSVAPIPCAALGVLSADKLAATLAKNPSAKLRLGIHSRNLPEATVQTVIGELRGREKADEIIVVGGHLDSWDSTPGAHDDGAGVVQAIEVLRLLKESGIPLKRTLRVVLFANEENGLRGGRAYAKLAAERREKHLLALESDMGGFAPVVLVLERRKGDGLAQKADARWGDLLVAFGLYGVKGGHGGSDVGPLQELGVAVGGFRHSSQRYFEYHHAATDTLAAVSSRELALGAAALASLAYLADLDGLPE